MPLIYTKLQRFSSFIYVKMNFQFDLYQDRNGFSIWFYVKIHWFFNWVHAKLQLFSNLIYDKLQWFSNLIYVKLKWFLNFIHVKLQWFFHTFLPNIPFWSLLKTSKYQKGSVKINDWKPGNEDWEVWKEESTLITATYPLDTALWTSYVHSI